MKTFKEYTNESKNSMKTAEKILKKYGEVHITITSTDTWANIDDIIDGIGYGIDQFDNDIEIDLSKDKYQIVERNLVESKIPFKVGVEYKLWDTDEPDFEANITHGIYLKTGKGRLSPNKGKDVYIFKATKEQDSYRDGKFKIGFWQIEDGQTSFKKI